MGTRSLWTGKNCLATTGLWAAAVEVWLCCPDWFWEASEDWRNKLWGWQLILSLLIRSHILKLTKHPGHLWFLAWRVSGDWGLPQGKAWEENTKNVKPLKLVSVILSHVFVLPNNWCWKGGGKKPTQSSMDCTASLLGWVSSRETSVAALEEQPPTSGT